VAGAAGSSPGKSVDDEVNETNLASP
jgi:hypothetical protein